MPHSSSLSGKPAPARHRRLCIYTVIAVVLVVAVLSPPYIDTIDAKVRVEVAHAIVDRGELAIQAIEGHDYLALPGEGGRRYSVYGIGQSLLLVPLDVLAKGISALVPVSEGARLVLRESLLAYVYVLLLAAVCARLMFAMLRQLGLSQRSATLGTLVVFIATPWLIWARSMQEETLAAAILLGATLLIARAKDGGMGLIAAAGLLLGLLANVRYNAVFAAGAVAIWTLWRVPGWTGRLKAGTALLAGALPGLLIAAAYNKLRFGSWTETGYMKSLVMLAGENAQWNFEPGRFAGLLAGLDCGLLWFALPLLLLPVLLGRRGRARELAALMLGGLLLNALFMAPAPGLGLGGGAGYCGPRYLAHGVITLAPFAFVALRAVIIRRRRPWPVLAKMLIAASVAVQAAAVPLSYHLESIQDQLAVDNPDGIHHPQPWMPRRAVNLMRLATGNLYEASLPATPQGREALTDRARAGVASFTVPELTPWRVLGAQAAGDKLPRWIMLIIVAAWCLLVLFTIEFLRRFMRRMGRPQAARSYSH